MRPLNGSESKLGWLAILVVVVAVLASTIGCSAIAKSIAKRLATREVERTIVVPRGSLDEYAHCFNTRGGDCEAGKANALGDLEFGVDQTLQDAKAAESVRGKRMDLVNQVLTDEVHAKLVDFHNSLLHRNGATNLTLEISEREFSAYQEKLENASLADSWCEAKLALAEGSDSAVISAYLCSYFRTYFRNGRFARLKFNTQEVLLELRRRFPGLSEDELKNLFEYLFDDDGLVFGEVGDAGFITRTGTKYQFPSIEVSISPFAQEPVTASEVDFNAVGADLVRIFWEAVFDAHDGLPAVSNATGVTVSAAPLRVHDPDHITNPDRQVTVNEREFGAVEWFSNQTEGWTSVAVGRLIRGAGPVALNNEALAGLVETLVGSIVRKVTEKASWCVFACGVYDLPLDRPLLYPTLFSDGETVTITVKVNLGT